LDVMLPVATTVILNGLETAIGQDWELGTEMFPQ
jgi:hypothetical protein